MKPKGIALILALVLLLGLTACGGTTATANQPAASGGKVQGVTDTEIIVANSATTSGKYAGVGLPFVNAIQAYFNMVNEAGGIDGRKITFLNKDDEFDPVKGKAYLQEFVEDDKVFCILGHFGTPVVSATIEDLKSYGIPSLYFATGIGQLFSDNAVDNASGYNIFPIQPLYITEGQVMVARGVGNFGATRIGMIYTSDDAGNNMYEGASKKAAELGIELVAEQVAAGSADVSAAVTTIKNAGVDFVIVGAIQATMPTIVKEMAAQGMTVPAITTYVCAAVSITEQIGDDIAGKFDVYASSWKIRDEEHQQDLDEFLKWMPEEYKSNTDAESGWVAASIFCQALRKLEGKEVTWESFMAALEDGEYDVPFGGTISFANGKRTGVQSMLLSKCDPSNPNGWTVVYGFANMDDIAAGKA